MAVSFDECAGNDKICLQNLREEIPDRKIKISGGSGVGGMESQS